MSDEVSPHIEKLARIVEKVIDGEALSQEERDLLIDLDQIITRAFEQLEAIEADDRLSRTKPPLPKGMEAVYALGVFHALVRPAVDMLRRDAK